MRIVEGKVMPCTDANRSIFWCVFMPAEYKDQVGVVIPGIRRIDLENLRDKLPESEWPDWLK